MELGSFVMNRACLDDVAGQPLMLHQKAPLLARGSPLNPKLHAPVPSLTPFLGLEKSFLHFLVVKCRWRSKPTFSICKTDFIASTLPTPDTPFMIQINPTPLTPSKDRYVRPFQPSVICKLLVNMYDATLSRITNQNQSMGDVRLGDKSQRLRQQSCLGTRSP